MERIYTSKEILYFITFVRAGTVIGLHICPKTYATSCRNRAEQSLKPRHNANEDSSELMFLSENMARYLKKWLQVISNQCHTWASKEKQNE